MLLSLALYNSMKVSLKKDSIVYLLLLFSPTVSLLIERGNNDQVAFFLVVMFCVFHKNKVVYFSAYYLSFLTKFFPFVIIFSLTERYNIKALKLGVLIFLPIFLYILLTFPEIIDLGRATPVSSPNIGYGWKIPLKFLSNYINKNTLTIIALLSLLPVLTFFLVYKTNSTSNETTNLDKKYLLMFKAGMLIYVGTYFIGTSWDYRLVFLILTIPFLLNEKSTSSLTTIIIIIFLFWSHQFVNAASYPETNSSFIRTIYILLTALKLIAHYILMFYLIYHYKSRFKISILEKQIS
jgi:hypothetical protein